MRIVVFADWDHWLPHVLVPALLSHVASHPTARVVAVCIRRPADYWRMRLTHAAKRATGWVKRICLGDRRYLRTEPAPVNLRALARRHGFEVCVVPDANNAATARLVRERLHADTLFSVVWKRFDPRFIALFEHTVNYHNGAVPDYRGLRATPWSIYRGEPRSGFTFHRITAAIDRGNVLVEAAVPIEPDASVFEVEWAKTRLAASRLPAVIAALLANDPGVPQRDAAKYNRVADVDRLTLIETPASVTAAELLLRIRAFGPVRMRLGSELVWISGLGAAVAHNDPPERHCMRLADGTWRVKTSDWRAHRLKRIKRALAPAQEPARPA